MITTAHDTKINTNFVKYHQENCPLKCHFICFNDVRGRLKHETISITENDGNNSNVNSSHDFLDQVS